MKYLVTGGLGVIGSFYARYLSERDDQVIVIDNGKDKRHEWNRSKLPSSVRVEELDLSDRKNLKKLTSLVSETDRVVHAAASTGIPWSGENPEADWDANVEGTRNLLRALVAHPKPTCALSSVKPYATFPMPSSGLDEHGGMAPDEPYAASKLAQSALCQAYGRSYGLPIVTFRCSNLYGPGAPHGPRHGWLTWFCIKAACHSPIEIQGSGTQRRDMLFASDVVSACESALYRAGSLRGAVFNLGGGPANVISVNQAVSELRRYVPELGSYPGPAREHEDSLFVTNTGRACAALDWAQRVNVRDGISRVYQWAVKNEKELRKVYEEYL